MNEQLDFREHIFLQNKLPDFYKTLNCNYSAEVNLYNNSNNITELNNDILIVKDIPRYFNVERKKISKYIRCFSVEQYSGFMINFKEVNHIDEYLKDRFGASSRYKLRRSIKKLETCFDISYKMYFGDIIKEEYDFVFDEFFKLLNERSIEKGIFNNRNIKRKDYYYELVHPLILQKKASLFVIYNGKQPIDICLNFHCNNMVYQLIRTYDINYSKFNTGYIDLIKQIEWCIDNKINFINFSYGDYYWKRRWCNTVYMYDYNIFYNSKSLKSITKAIIYKVEIKVRQALRAIGFIDKYHEIIVGIKNKFNSKKSIELEVSNIDFSKKIDVDSEIDISINDYKYLRRSIYDFLFNFNEQEKNLKVYKSKNSVNNFLVLGKKSKIIIRNK